MGAAALALVRYPWQQIPGYSIQFLPISDAPSPGFYGNTDFTWGEPGGVSTLYVYPGETVEQLAGIIGFEIGHEVDAAYVEPQGGHAQIEAALGVSPGELGPRVRLRRAGLPVGLVRRRLLRLLVAGGRRMEHAGTTALRRRPRGGRALARPESLLGSVP